MSTYRLDRVFAPRSVAIVGATPRPGSLGRAVLENVRAGGFAGVLSLVNPKHRDIDGIACVPRLEDLAEAPDLVVVVTPPATIPSIIESAGRLGAAGAIIITAGLGRGPNSHAEAARIAARKYGLRIIGPNCLGLLCPKAQLNASFAASGAKPGDVAFISQSGAVEAALIEWALPRGIGFSALVSLGDQVDVDFADCLDFFAADGSTRAILMYIEAIGDARKFMSAARAAARTKPVVVIKAGRHAQGAKAAATHTGALAGSDAVYDAAFRRAGLLRVFDLDELFGALETLSRSPPFFGKRLAVLTNGGGVGVLAVDRLVDRNATLAALSDETIATLDSRMPSTWSRSNPVDIVGDADAERFSAALEILLKDPANDAILVLNVPTALASSADAARAIARVVEQERKRASRRKPVLAVWLGEDEASRQAFERAGIPHYATEAEAIRGFTHVVGYHEALELLQATPDSLPKDFAPDTATARGIVREALKAGREWLDPIAVNGLLAAFGIPTIPIVLAKSPDEAVAAAQPIIGTGGTVALKILSPDITHKSDVGGVVLDLSNERAVRSAAAEILERVARVRPEARVDGLMVQQMVRRPKARELIAGLADDPTFGPVVAFGHGGTAVEVINDKALALPPLDLKLAEMLVARTRVARLLKAYRNVPAANEREVQLTLVKLSQLAADIPEIRELDLNPLLADETGVIAVDARVRVAADIGVARGAGHPRFALRPYPKEWERTVTLRGGRSVFVRPIRPEDEEALLSFLKQVSPADLRLRFFAPIREFSHAFLARLVQIDYARAIAFVAFDEAGNAMGVVRLHADANHERGEYAVLVRSDLKGIGLGWELMKLMLEWARADGLRKIEGQVLSGNTVMLDMCGELGFQIAEDPDEPGTRRVSLEIT